VGAEERHADRPAVLQHEDQKQQEHDGEDHGGDPEAARPGAHRRAGRRRRGAAVTAGVPVAGWNVPVILCCDHHNRRLSD
jgi:hypothetical protein